MMAKNEMGIFLQHIMYGSYIVRHLPNAKAMQFRNYSTVVVGTLE